MSEKGFFAIGIYRTKTESNVGTLWRHARLYGAAYVFTIGRRYKKQSSDTCNTPLHVPLFHYETIDELQLPHGAPLVGIELDIRARPLSGYGHPRCGVYLLGAEDHGLPPAILARCHSVVQIEAPLGYSMNVATAGTIVMHDRHVRGTCRALRSA